MHRDGEEHHKLEEYTGFLARYFAKILGGACVTWKERERVRIKKLGEPDPLNRDPNYLLDEELHKSPWLVRIKEVIAFLNRNKASKGVVHIRLHIDVHGMSDHHESDCVIGTKVATSQLFDRKQRAVFKEEDGLHEKLAKSLNPILSSVGLKPVEFNKADLVISFSGKWRTGSKRNTLSQLTSNELLFGENTGKVLCSLQMELSNRLRKMLASNPALRNCFACALFEMM